MGYWKPGHDYETSILEAVKGKIDDDDFLVISEKALSTVTGNFVNEERVKPSLMARFLAGFWMPVIWGYFLGVLCHFNPEMIKRLRVYPRLAGSRHKQVALENAGFFQALMFGSEGALDGSNLPFSLVSLPLGNSDAIASRIRRKIVTVLGKRVCVVISDSDKTYSFGNFHFTPRPKPLMGIHSGGGLFAYLVGRALRFKRRATPVAVSGCSLNVEKALRVAQVANRARGSGAGRTVWDMAEGFGVGLSMVTWQMLDTVKHKPIVIVKAEG